jgi:predicted ATP-grasp superfamily ATP-dependent carboligase
MSSFPPVVILGGQQNALAAARSLGARGVSVHTVGEFEGHVVGSSRFVHRGWRTRDPDHPKAEWMQWFERGWAPGAVVFPCSDAALEYLATVREPLRALGYRPLEAADDVTLAMLDKAATYEAAARVGVDVPRTEVVRTIEDVDRVAATFAYPCALKPCSSHRFTLQFGVKAVRVATDEELRKAFARIRPSGLEMLVTEIVPGVDDEYRSYYTYLDDRGEPLFHFTKRKLRQYPPGFGLGTYHDTLWDPEVAELGLRFLSGVGLRGIGNVEFKRDARDGRLKLIECNPRLTAADRLVQAAGTDIPYVAYRRAAGLPVDEPQECRDGVSLWDPGADIRAFLLARAVGDTTTRAWLAGVARPHHLPYFEWRDPMPSVTRTVRRLPRLARGVRRRAIARVRR